MSDLADVVLDAIRGVLERARARGWTPPGENEPGPERELRRTALRRIVRGEGTPGRTKDSTP